MDGVELDRTGCKNVVVNDKRSWSDQLLNRLGEQIGEARSARNISAVKLAALTEKLGAPVHRVAIARIEKGEQAPTVPELVAIGVALETDWAGWLIKASEGLTIRGARDDHAYLRRMLAEVNDEIAALEQNLFQAEEAPKHFRMVDPLKEKIAADADRYRGMIDALQVRRNMILDMLGHTDA